MTFIGIVTPWMGIIGALYIFGYFLVYHIFCVSIYVQSCLFSVVPSHALHNLITHTHSLYSSSPLLPRCHRSRRPSRAWWTNPQTKERQPKEKRRKRNIIIHPPTPRRRRGRIGQPIREPNRNPGDHHTHTPPRGPAPLRRHPHKSQHQLKSTHQRFPCLCM